MLSDKPLTYGITLQLLDLLLSVLTYFHFLLSSFFFFLFIYPSFCFCFFFYRPLEKTHVLSADVICTTVSLVSLYSVATKNTYPIMFYLITLSLWNWRYWSVWVDFWCTTNFTVLSSFFKNNVSTKGIFFLFLPYVASSRLRCWVSLSICHFLMIFKISSTYRQYNRGAHVTCAVDIGRCPESSFTLYFG